MRVERALLCFVSLIFIFLASCTDDTRQSWTDLSFPPVPDSILQNPKRITFIRWEVAPVQYFKSSQREQLNWLGVAGTRQVIRIFPNNQSRRQMGINEVKNITGVNHFLLDMDLVSGYVHDYTRNFFNRLRPDDFVMRYQPSEDDSTTGIMTFVRKKDLGPGDILGKTIAFFRQWKLSELVMEMRNGDIYIKVKPCSYAPQLCVCPEVKASSGNPFSVEVPLWHKGVGNGFQPLSALNKTGRYDGGNVVLIWEYGNNIWFQEMRGSLSQVIEKALDIQEICSCEPVLAISDSGPMSAGVKSNDDFVLNTTPIDTLEDEPLIGAGYGYFPGKVGVYSYVDSKGKTRQFITTY